MESAERLKSWIKEQAPMLAGLYENKYVGMLYDRFASLPPKQQKHILVGIVCGITGIVVVYLLLCYLSLWSINSDAANSATMTNMLLQYQKLRRDKGQQIKALERNAALTAPGQFKQQLQNIGRLNNISPRMMEIKEKSDATAPNEEGKAGAEVKLKQASVVIKKVNLTQLVAFLKGLEFGTYNLNVSSIKIDNDDKMRGYMNVELNVVAYLFTPEEG